MSHPIARGILSQFVMLGALTASSAAEVPPGRPSEAQTVAGFEARLQDYQGLHRKLESTLAKLPRQPTQQQADQHRRALADLIRSARHDAKPGELLTPDVQAVVRRILAEVLSGPSERAAVDVGKT